MTKTKQSNYEKKVSEAREIVALLRLSNKHRMQVAKIACELCIITHGGRQPPTRYNLKKFSADIGLKHDTLYEWVRVYRYVYAKLTPNLKENFHTFPSNLLRPAVKGLNEKATPSHVQKKFKQVLEQGRTTSKMTKYVQNLSSILYNVSNHSRMIDASDKVLIELYEKASLIKGYLDKEFEARRLKTKPTIRQPKIDMTKFWHEDVVLGEEQ